MKKTIQGFDIGNGLRVMLITNNGNLVARQESFRLPRKLKKKLKNSNKYDTPKYKEGLDNGLRFDQVFTNEATTIDPAIYDKLKSNTDDHARDSWKYATFNVINKKP